MMLKICPTYCLVFFAFTLGCRHAPTSGRSPQQGSADALGQGAKPCLGIVDGAVTNDYPATYLILDLDNSGQVAETCTGTFVGDNVLLTAAHCIPAGGAAKLVAVSNQASVVKGQANLQQVPHGLKVFMDASIPVSSSGPDLSNVPMSKDLAVVLFSAGTAPAVTPVARTASAVGTAVTLVGYGANDTAQTQADSSPTVEKKFGANTIAPVDQDYPYDGLYQVRAWGHAGEAAQHGVHTVSAAPGDSGGPLLRGNVLIGTVKYGYTTAEVPDLQTKIGTDTLGFWVDITNPSAQALLQQASQGGAHITYEDQVAVQAPSGAAAPTSAAAASVARLPAGATAAPATAASSGVCKNN